jgi:hypothetical protein
MTECRHIACTTPSQRLSSRLVFLLDFDNNEVLEAIARKDVDEAFGTHGVRHLDLL